MNDNNSYGGGLPDDIDYSAPQQKLGAPTGVNAPVLDDIDYVAPTAKKDGPTGVAAPVLDDMDVYVPDSGKKGGPTGVSAPVLDDMSDYSSAGEKKGAPTGVSAPVLDDQDYSSAPKKLILSDDDIINGLTPDLRAKFEALPADKQQQIIEMRRTQLGAEAPAPQVTAPVLDDDDYTPPPKKEEPPKPETNITAPILDDEPEAPKYVRKFADEDLEKAKRDAKKAVSASLSSDQKDPKKSLEMMLKLKEERLQEVAQKGFRITIVLSILGIISAVCFYLLYSGKLGLTYKDGLSGISSTVESSSLYIAIAAGMCALALITGMGGFKSLCSLVYLLYCLIQVFPGVMMVPQHEGNIALAGGLYAAALLCSLAVFISLSASEAVGQYFKRNSQK
ncbi:MAG: ABC transporter permease [Ruminococcus sp.]|nr:ABC transporter permease [Ruminococcus sp.]